MLLSIIIPVYNVEKYISRCLDSLISQIDNEVEIICVDDGSSDRSGLICEHYANISKQIKVIHQPNSGVGMARSVGLANANGVYIAWCDSDDYVHDNWYRSIKIKLMSKPDCVIIGLTKLDKNRTKFHRMKIKNELDRENYVFELSCDKEIKSYLCTHIIKREILEQCNLNIKYRYYEDYDFFTKFSVYLNKILVIKQSLYYYDIRYDSLTNSKKTIEQIEMMYDIALNRCLYFKEKKLKFSYSGFLKTLIIACVYDLFFEYEKHFYINKGRLRTLKNKILLSNKLEIQYKLIAALIYGLPYKILIYIFCLMKRRKNL